MIDEKKYEGHSERIDANEIGEIWEYLADTISEDNLRRAEANYNLAADAPLLLAEVIRLREIINKAMQQHTVLEMRGQLFESECIDAEGQYESGHWERDEEVIEHDR